jgi:hypothetical protein
MRVVAPIQVKVEGFPLRRHGFVSAGHVLGELHTGLFSVEGPFHQADGEQFVIRPTGLLSGTYLMQQGEVEIAAAEGMEITYRAVPYYLQRAVSLGAHQLQNEQDAVVFEITRHGFLAAGTQIEMLRDADLPRVVLAYFMVRRRVQGWRRRVGPTR